MSPILKKVFLWSLLALLILGLALHGLKKSGKITNIENINLYPGDPPAFKQNGPGPTDFRGPTSPPHVNGPTSPPPQSAPK